MDAALTQARDLAAGANFKNLPNRATPKAEYKSVITDSFEAMGIKTPGRSKQDSVQINFQDLYKSLTLTAKEIIDKLNELLKADLPDGLQSFKPADVTPEKTADRIVKQVTGLFGLYAKQNPDLEGEDLVNGFMDTIRGGVQKGYDEAFAILEGLGAFGFDDVQGGVERTKELIDEKLGLFEQELRKSLGLEATEPETITQDSVADPFGRALLAQAGGGILKLVA